MAMLVYRWTRSNRKPAVLAIGAGVVLLVILGFSVSGRLGIPAAIVAAAIPITVGLVGQVVASDRQNRREINSKLRERKSEVYEAFIQFWMDMLVLPENQKSWKDGTMDQEVVKKKINDLSKPMMLWASNDVVQSYSDFRRLSASGQHTGAPLRFMLHFEKMLFLMREDLGHAPSGFRERDLLAFFVNDIDEFEKLSA